MNAKLVTSADVGEDSAPKGTELEVIHHRDALHAMATLNGLSPEELQCVQESKSEIIEGFLRLINRFKKKHKRIALARDILGNDRFISPEDITARFPQLVYTDEQIAMLDASLPEEGKLWKMKDEGVHLCAPWPSPQSLLQVRVFRKELFHSKGKRGWYVQPQQTFASQDKTSLRWIALSESTVPSNSFSFSYDRLPNVAEILSFLVAFHDVRNIRMFDGKLIATSSKNSMGNHVALGFTGKCINVIDDAHLTFRGLLRIEVAPSSSFDTSLVPALK